MESSVDTTGAQFVEQQLAHRPPRLCGFAHERTDTLCSATDRTENMACPHGSWNVRVPLAIDRLVRLGTLSKSEADAFKVRWDETQRQLNGADTAAYTAAQKHQPPPPDSVERQEVAVHTREAIIGELRALMP